MASISNRSAFTVKLTQALTKQNRSIFAQRRLKPEDVLPERRKSAAVLGGEANVERFVSRAATQLGAPVQPVKQHFKLLTELLPGTVQERLAVEGLCPARCASTSNSPPRKAPPSSTAPDQFAVMVVDALVAVIEVAQCRLAALVAPEVESLDEVMHQFVAHHDQFLNLGSDLGDPLRSHGHAVADGHGDAVGRDLVLREQFALEPARYRVALEEGFDQRTQGLVRDFLQVRDPLGAQRVGRPGELVVGQHRLHQSLVLLQPHAPPQPTLDVEPALGSGLGGHRVSFPWWKYGARRASATSSKVSENRKYPLAAHRRLFGF